MNKNYRLNGLTSTTTMIHGDDMGKEERGRISGSSIERRIKCQLSGRLEPTIVSLESTDSKKGTNAHDLINELLEQFADKEVNELLLYSALKYKGVATDDVRDEENIALKVVTCVMATKAIIKECEDPEVYVAQKLKFPGLEGSTEPDVLIFDQPRAKGYVIDFKTGYWTVRAEENAQLMFYAICAQDACFTSLGWDVEEWELIIIQPNQDEMSRWTPPKGRLAKFNNLVLALDKELDQPKSLTDCFPSPGSWCQYCTAKVACPAYAGVAMMDKPDATTKELPDSTITWMIRNLPSLEGYVKAAKAHLSHRLEVRRLPDGYKAIRTSGRRGVPTKAAAIAAMKADFDALGISCVREMPMTIGQLEKFGAEAKKLVDKHCPKSGGSLKIVPDSAKGEAAWPELINAASKMKARGDKE